jgi:release factor glutamine methyltransferase
VLTPRLETEALVLGVARFFSNREFPEIIIDVGTGSGAIAISLYDRFQLAEFYATDISESALLVAQSNAAHNAAPIKFLRGNLLDRLLESEALNNLMNRRVLIVANLPYIGEDEEIGEDVRLEDPAIALYGGGADGFDCIQNLLEQSKKMIGVAHSVHVALEF